MRSWFAFVLGAAAGAMSVLVVQKVIENDANDGDSLTDRMEEQIGALEERLGIQTENDGA